MRLLPLALLLAGCGGLKPGLTKDGAAVAVDAPTLAEARAAAVAANLDLFVDRGSPEGQRAAELVAKSAGDFVAREKYKKGKGVLEVRFAKLASALDKEKLLRPAGYASKEPVVMLLVAEPDGILDLGVGPGADSLRRHLNAYGFSAVDGRDGLNGFTWKNGTADVLTAAARKAGADWLLVAAANVSAAEEPSSKMWQGKAVLVADAYRTDSAKPVDQVRAETTVLDVSSSAARGKAIEAAGEEAAGKAAGVVQKALGGRSEAAVFIQGGDLADLRRVMGSLRAVEGVAGAYLASWRGEDGAVARAFLSGIRTDGLAARLMRREPLLILQSVEPDDGRLSVEVERRRDD